MKISKSIALGALLSGLAFQAQALDMNKPSVYSYNYVQGGYMMHEGISGDGFMFGASFDFNRTMGLQLNYETLTSEETFFTTKYTTEINVLQVGTGYHHKYDYSSVSPGNFLSNMDLWYKVGVERSTLTSKVTGFPAAEDSKTGVYAGALARKEMIDNLQLTLALMYHSARYIEGPAVAGLAVSTRAAGRAFEVNIEGMYNLTSGLAGYLSYRVFDTTPFAFLGNFATTTLGLRYTF